MSAKVVQKVASPKSIEKTLPFKYGKDSYFNLSEKAELLRARVASDFNETSFNYCVFELLDNYIDCCEYNHEEERETLDEVKDNIIEESEKYLETLQYQLRKLVSKLRYRRGMSYRYDNNTEDSEDEMFDDEDNDSIIMSYETDLDSLKDKIRMVKNLIKKATSFHLM
jgi:hypothetical protein